MEHLACITEDLVKLGAADKTNCKVICGTVITLAVMILGHDICKLGKGKEK